MSLQTSIPVSETLQELDNLYYAGSVAAYEAALQVAITNLQAGLPDCTIAFAEIGHVGMEQRLHGGMRHVLMAKERNA